jgi:hypothetical protein
VENAYYTVADAEATPGGPGRKFLGAMVNPIIGRPMLPSGISTCSNRPS